MIYGIWMTEDGMQIAAFKGKDEVLEMFRESEEEPVFVRVEDIDETSESNEIALIRGEAFVPKPTKKVTDWDFGDAPR